MRLVSLRLLVTVSVLAAVAACSEDDGGGGGNGNDNGGSMTCDYTPCGGDPTGTWTVGETCAENELLPLDDYPGCAGAVATGSGDVSGTQSYEADGSYAYRIEFTGNFHYEIHEDCALALTDGMIGAEGYCGVLPLALAGMGGTADCNFADDVCTCDIDLDTVLEETGTWSVEGDRLITTSDEPDSEPVSDQFCVSGDELMMGEPGEFAASYSR